MTSKLGCPTVSIRSVAPRPQRTTSMPWACISSLKWNAWMTLFTCSFPEVKDEHPHPTVSRRASSSASPPNGGSE